MTKDEALKMAIKSLERYGDTYGGADGDFEALQACEEALEQPVQRNFCERCGKRASKVPYHIHTCTPSQALKEKNHG